MHKIISLEAANVKRLKAVRIEPDGNLVVIGGDNAQGKTSVLDAITYALGGKGGIPEEVLRKGQEKGYVEIDLGDMIVKRTFTEKGGTLTVTNKEGLKYPSPQAMLDSLVGRLSFDPLAFQRMTGAAQLVALRELVGVDTSAIEEQRDSAYARRTEKNREVRRMESEVEALPFYKEIGLNSVDVAPLVETRNAMLAKAEAIRTKSAEVKASEQRADSIMAALETAKEKVEILKDDLSVADQAFQDADAELGSLGDEPDFTLVDREIGNAAETNNKVMDNRFWQGKAKDLERVRDEAMTLTEEIQQLDQDKARLVEHAEFPVDGLGFDSLGVTFSDVAFDECSGAEQLRVSVAMGLAANPDLKVLLVRDGSLLDSKSLAMLQQMAEEADAQVWVERVGHGEEVQIVMVDGEVQDGE